MNIYVLYYDAFWQQELGFPLNQLRNENITAVALENRPYVSAEKQKFLPDKTIDDININDIDMLIIPGGDTTHLLDNSRLKGFINRVNDENKYIGGICGGTVLMAAYGLLDGKNCTTAGGTGLKPGNKFNCWFENANVLAKDVVVDGNLITAIGQAFVEFAVELGKIANIYDNEEEAIAEYKWLRKLQ